MIRPGRFLFSGAINTVMSYIAFLAVFSSSESAALALISGLWVGISSSYLLNRYWIWKSDQPNTFGKFLFFQLALLFLNWLLLHLISLTPFPREIAQGIIYLVLAPLSYKIYSRIFLKGTS